MWYCSINIRKGRFIMERNQRGRVFTGFPPTTRHREGLAHLKQLGMLCHHKIHLRRKISGWLPLWQAEPTNHSFPQKEAWIDRPKRNRRHASLKHCNTFGKGNGFANCSFPCRSLYALFPLRTQILYQQCHPTEKQGRIKDCRKGIHTDFPVQTNTLWQQ